MGYQYIKITLSAGNSLPRCYKSLIIQHVPEQRRTHLIFVNIESNLQTKNRSHQSPRQSDRAPLHPTGWDKSSIVTTVVSTSDAIVHLILYSLFVQFGTYVSRPLVKVLEVGDEVALTSATSVIDGWADERIYLYINARIERGHHPLFCFSLASNTVCLSVSLFVCLYV